MENKLKQLFEFQRFENDPRLAALIAAAEGDIRELDDDELSLVSAAGIPEAEISKQE